VNRQIKITPAALQETCEILGITKQQFLDTMSSRGFDVEIV